MKTTQALTARTAAVIRGDLDDVSDSIEPLSQKLAAAEERMAAIQATYDESVHGFALGQLATEPSRADLFAAIQTVDGLRRVRANAMESARRLTAEFEAVHTAELADQARVRISPLIAAAESRLAEFEAALFAARQAEADLFGALYSEAAGLRQPFGPDFCAVAQQTRISVAARARAAAEKFGIAANPRFSSDGDVCLGDAGPAFFRSLAKG